ncbi:hypothetical protein SPRG_14763 [Saprolegnia parasitica CBS 223.65]|uniref:HSF-type DNA-binding domain-containing protein n=1 Tax=Saprolegnia parasitica (strain CBS 223.65) TaxID=695850 RepID=A0A067BN95_SAPPC|nr:hypothetical protein SPRG_14763 [Saprolegnia parasitica CBS 223.65]KDO19683.1 hypothetical protein SPRG_14763 [Saprolegnia parasitica CBS 223.65]|eukprot:XP_012209600.1 hypothetical protein SPRG_14763 [Saprolegnia parasitica CBS 223.65]
MLSTSSMSSTSSTSCLLRKLHRVLSQESPSIVAWSDCGKHVAVHDAPRFEANIVPTYFRLRTLCEFRALLCQHGFDCSDELSFSHSDLSRDCPMPFAPKKRASGKVLSKATKTRHHPYGTCTTTTTASRGGDELWSALAAVCLQSSETSHTATNPLFQKHTSFETQPDAWQLLNGHSVVCV